VARDRGIRNKYVVRSFQRSFPLLYYTNGYINAVNVDDLCKLALSEKTNNKFKNKKFTHGSYK